MRRIETSAYEVAQRFIGVKEVPGAMSDPLILGWLQLDGDTWVHDDETPWCSAFCNFVARCLGLLRSKKLSARSWLTVGTDATADPEIGLDVVVLWRGGPPQPGPAVLEAPGHVGFFGGFDDNGDVLLLAGNQNDQVNITAFPRSRILAIRRLI